MSKSIILKLAFAVLLLLPTTGKAAELKFNDKTWPVEILETNEVEVKFVRNDFDLQETATSVLTGKKQVKKSKLYNPTTLGQIETALLEINRPPQSAEMVIENNRAVKFQPDLLGQALDLYELRKRLKPDSQIVELPVNISYPKVRMTELNSLGINELVAIGESDFTGSPYNRRVNIKVGADKFNGIIIKPGEEFSFNTYLGDVDGEHGFLPELVIKKTGVVPEFGGGLCQVSSTAFRAAMNAGLPIVERRNHSFAVKYYAPQGTDATIYPGVTDFRFKNDLASHLLIRTRIDGNKLYYEFYGTKDERKVSFDGPYQYDKKANGAMKATWTRWVEKDGEKKEQVFNSTYQPPALFQQVTQSSTPNPQDPNSTTAPQPTPPPPPATT